MKGPRRTLKEIVIEAIRQGHDIDTCDIISMFGEAYGAMFATDALVDHDEEAEGINNFFDCLRFMVMQEYDIEMNDLEIETFHRINKRFNLKRDFKYSFGNKRYLDNLRYLERVEMKKENK